MTETHTCNSPEETFELGTSIGHGLNGDEILLLTGGLGAGKTLLTKGILNALDFDADEVTSPSFTFVNLYKTEKFDVYHIDLWRIESGDAAFAVGLDEILEDENAVVIVEWAEKLGEHRVSRETIWIRIDGEGEDARNITLEFTEHPADTSVK